MECVTDRIFCHFGQFFALLPPSNQKNQTLKKGKKCLKILSFYTWVPKMTIIWCMVPEILSATDKIFCHFELFFAHYPLPPLLITPKKPPGDNVILHKCTINENHMMYGSWYMKCDGQNFLLFWTIFCPFSPLTTQKIKIFKKWKKCLEILSFYTSIPQRDSQAYEVYIYKIYIS